MSVQAVIPEFSKILQESTTEEDGTCGHRNTAILLYILGMVDRGDSKETIRDVYYFLSSYPEPKPEPVGMKLKEEKNQNEDYL